MGRVLNKLLHYQVSHSAIPCSAAGMGLRREACEPELQKGWERVAFVEGEDGLSMKGMAEKYRSHMFRVPTKGPVIHLAYPRSRNCHQAQAHWPESLGP